MRVAKRQRTSGVFEEEELLKFVYLEKKRAVQDSAHLFIDVRLNANFCNQGDCRALREKSYSSRIMFI